MKQKSLLCLLLVVICQRAFTQQWQRHDNTIHYSEQNGLKNSYVKAIVEDKYGFLWLGTINGLVRYDGKDFKYISKKKPKANEIDANNIYSLFIYDNYLWKTGVNCSRMNIETQEWESYDKIYSKDTFYNYDEAFEVFQDSKKQIWLTTPYFGLAKFNAKRNRFEAIAIDNQKTSRDFDWVNKIFENQNQELIFSESNGIVVLKNDRVVKRIPWPIKQNQQFRTSCMYFENNKIWVNIDAFGMYQYDFTTQKWTETKIKSKQGFKSFSSYEIPKFIGAKKSNGCFALQQTFFNLEFNPTENLFYEIKQKYENIKNIYVQYLTKDGNLWMGNKEGLYKISNNENYVQEKLDISSVFYDYYNASWDHEHQKLYFGKVYNFDNLYAIDLKSNLKSIPIKGDKIFPSQFYKFGDKLFITSKFKVAYLQNNTQFDLKQLPLHTNRFMNYRSDTYKEFILFSGINSIMYLYHIGKDTCIQIKTNFKAPNVSSDFVFAYFSPNGNIMASNLASNYFVEYNLKGELIRRIDLPKDFLTNEFILEYRMSDENTIWLNKSNHGIYEFNLKTNKIREYYNIDYFDILNCEHLIFDNEEHIWAYSREGLYTINVKTKVAKRIDNKLNFNLNLVDASITPFRKGEILYYSAGKAFVIKPNAYGDKQIPFIFLEDLKVMGRKSSQNIFNQDKIILEAGENTFDMNFGVVNTHIKTPIIYSWKIEEISEQWISQPSQNINYAGINPGSYTLYLRAQSAEGTFEDVIKKIEIIVKPKWHQTLWFKLLIGLAALLLIYYFYKLNLRNKLQKQKVEIEKQLAVEKERNRIARDMHDDLGAGLSKIKYLSDEALLNSENENTKKLLELNKQNSDELVDKMNDIIWTLNNKDETLEDLIIKMRSNFGQWLNDIDKTLILEVDEFKTEIKLDEFKKRNLFLAVKEAINNSVKYAKTKEVFLNIKQIGNELVVQIIDMGAGFDVEKMKLKGNGLSNFHKRLNEINGSVSIQSNENGTKVQFTIPV